MSNVLVTGGAGFVGYHFSKKILDNNFSTIIIDNLDDYYDIELKLKRLSLLGIDASEIKYGKEQKSKTYKNLRFVRGDICDKELVESIFSKNNLDYVVHMAARSGARDSFSNPLEYIKNNVEGTTNMLDIANKYNVKHFLFTSSSSVYGNMEENKDISELKPISLYGATKLSAEIIAETYAKAKKLPITIARLFSVYGPLGRPDGFIFRCIESIKNEISIELFNNGEMWRDFIYVKDVGEILFRILLSIPESGFKIYDVGSGNATKITEVLQFLEEILGKKSIVKSISGSKNESIITKAHKELIYQNVNLEKISDLKANLKDFLQTQKVY
jgi:UDP-glucuronate 4-epimerase